MNMMFGVQCEKMVHKSKTIPTSRLDHVGDMIPYNQMIVHGSEMVQGIHTTHGNDTAETAPDAPPTTARHRRKISNIWEHFTTETNSDGCTRACCNYCKRTFACSKTAGTSHLKRHISLGSCPVMKGQVPPSSGRTGNRGSCAAKRQCLHAGPGNDTFNRNGNTLYLGNMDILTEVFKIFFLISVSV